MITTATINRPLEFVADTDRPVRGRRMSWAEFYRLFPDRRPANDNGKQERLA